MGSVTFRYDEDDIVAANRAYQRAALRRRPFILFTLSMLLWPAALGGFLAAQDGTSIWPAAAGGFTIGALIVGLLVGIGHWNAGRYARRNFAQQRNLADTYRFSWDENGFESVSDHGSTRMAWRELHRWSDDDTLIMLYLAERLYIGVPKRALDPAPLESLRDALERAGPARL